MAQRISHWVDGQNRPGTSGRTSPVFNPAAGEVAAEVELASAAEVDDAMRSAKEAAATWRTSSLSRRAHIMFEIRQQLSARADELVDVITAAHGQVHSD